MAKPCVGIDIGSCQLHFAVCSDGAIRRTFACDIPENLVRGGQIVSAEATAEFLKQAAADAKINVRRAALVLPAPACYVRTMSVPAMTSEDLAINLPYEFRDFITQEKDKYFYDYAVLSREDNAEGAPVQFNLLAATTLKETIAQYAQVCQSAGLKLVTAVPEEAAYMNIIRSFEQSKGIEENQKEYCFLDLGHTSIRILIFKGVTHQATRIIDYGMQSLDIIIADRLGVDPHIARAHKHTNNQNELADPLCQNFYSNVSVEVMRALKFYSFNTPDSNLQDIYLCGGGHNIHPLVKLFENELEFNITTIDALLPYSTKSNNGDAAICQTAIGAALQ